MPKDVCTLMEEAEARFRSGEFPHEELFPEADEDYHDDTEWAPYIPAHVDPIWGFWTQSRGRVTKCEWCGTYYCGNGIVSHQVSCPQKPKEDK